MISERARRIRPSGIRKMAELASRMDDPVNLSIGQPHFDAPKTVQDAAIRAIQSGANGYTPTRGIPLLNRRLEEALGQRWGRPPGGVMMTSGVTGGLMLSYLALLDPNDEVLLPEPYFPVYRELAEVLKIGCSTYDLHPDFRLTREVLEAGRTERTRVLLLNSPANPTGVVLTQEEVDLAVAFAREHDLVILSDEIYEAFCYDGDCPTPASQYEKTVVLGGFSKTYGVPGWRLGFAAGPAEVLDEMAKIQMFSYVCANSVGQHAALDAMDYDVTPFVDDYRRRRDRLYEALEPLYGPVRPGGAFYLYPPVPGGGDAEAFVQKACEKKLVVVPGTAFSERSTHFRISYAVSDSQLDRGITLLRELADG